MHVYRAIRFEGDLNPVWCGTLSEAHGDAKNFSGSYIPGGNGEIRIELFDVPTDKAGVIAMLSGAIEDVQGPVLRTWALTPRLGLKEVPNGE